LPPSGRVRARNDVMKWRDREIHWHRMSGYAEIGKDGGAPRAKAGVSLGGSSMSFPPAMWTSMPRASVCNR
jgi:hypothetical protein